MIGRPSRRSRSTSRGPSQKAIADRTDIAQAKKTLESNDVTLRDLVDQTLPALDLTAGYGLAGVGGPVFVRGGLGGTVEDIIPGGFSDTLRTLAISTRRPGTCS